jgi:molybdopterin-guanine dinucleotide biosynthesis protein A
MRRLAPQVESVAINANRHLDDYAALGAPVWADSGADRPGPLAGFLAGLARCETPYLATVPCDCPLFPLDLVARLATAFAADERLEIALAATPGADGPRAEPVFALMRADLHASLDGFLKRGERKVESWAKLHRCELVVFADAAAFFNVNTRADLRALEAKR